MVYGIWNMVLGINISCQELQGFHVVLILFYFSIRILNGAVTLKEMMCTDLGLNLWD